MFHSCSFGCRPRVATNKTEVPPNHHNRIEEFLEMEGHDRVSAGGIYVRVLQSVAQQPFSVCVSRAGVQYLALFWQVGDRPTRPEVQQQ